MSSLRFCRHCLYASDHPLGLTFDESGLCSGCRVHQEKDSLDWREREFELRRLLEPYRLRQGGTAYDCVVPVTGAGDSFYQVHLVKNVLGLRPLIVHYNSQFNSTVGIQNLARLREAFNVDAIQMNVSPVSLRKITRAMLTSHGHVYWHVLAGQTSYPVQTAVKMGIPLVIWGAHQGVEQVGMHSHLDNVEMSRRYRREHDLMGLEADDLLTSTDVLAEEDIASFRYPHDDDLISQGTRGIYLSNFFRWDPLAQHREMSAKFGYRGMSNNRSFDPYDHCDSNVYMGLHDWLKLVRRGYSKVTDQASREIRHGRISRAQALSYVRRHELAPPCGVEALATWLGASQRSVDLVSIQHRNSAYWHGPYGELGAFRGWSTYQSPATDAPTGERSLCAEESSNLTILGRGHPRRHLESHDRLG